MRHLRLLALFAGAFALAVALTTPRDADAQNGAWGTIKGTVKLPSPPASEAINVTTDKEHCLSKGPLTSEMVLVGKTGGVKNVVVWLRPDTTDRKDPFPQAQINPALKSASPKTVTVDQPCCQFIPRVVALRVGDSIEFKNSAPVNHNINYASDAEPFNVNLPNGGVKKTAPLQPQTSPITFKCDIHPWMQGRARVFDHPYFATTDDTGTFEIKDAPAGKWRLVYWHEGGFHKGRDGALGFPVEVKAGGVTDVPAINLELPKG